MVGAAVRPRRRRFWPLDRRLVLGSDEAALDPQCAVAIDANENAGAGDVGGIEPDRPVLEGRLAVSISARR